MTTGVTQNGQVGNFSCSPALFCIWWDMRCQYRRKFEGKWIANRQHDGSNTSKGTYAKFLDCEFNFNPRFTSRRLSTKLVRSARRRRTHHRINFMGMMNDLEATDTPHKNDDFPPAHRIFLFRPGETRASRCRRTFPCNVTSNHEFGSECLVLNVKDPFTLFAFPMLHRLYFPLARTQFGHHAR